MTFHAHNTLTRRKEPLEPLVDGKVGFYVCGPTVYDLIHIGNARPLVVFDVLFRLLRHTYGDANVTYVRNITDVDDKINAAAAERGIAIRELTETTAQRFHEDAVALGCLEPSHEPRATDHIPEMIAMIEALIARGHAYEADGHVLFDVPSWETYGRLSGNSRDEIVAGARIDVAPYKKDAADFVLWKPSTGDLPGWESPWGYGRPGWHLECSAMSERYLGKAFDIHGGGRDLIFPHHENEIAQTCAAHDHAGFASIWMHNGYLTVNGEKMSKSLGNFFTVRELLEEYPGEALRLLLLGTHYRQALDFTKERLAEAKQTLDRWYGALQLRKRALHVTGLSDSGDSDIPPDVIAALNDDLNTPQLIAQEYGPNAEANAVYLAERKGDWQSVLMHTGWLKASGRLLGILQRDPDEWFRGRTSGDEAEEIEGLIEQRLAARKGKDFAVADRIRDELKARGIELMDGPEGTSWRRV